MLSKRFDQHWTSAPRERIGGLDDCEHSNMLDATKIQADAPRGAHSQDSSLREQALGHRFLAELLSLMWRDGRRDIEVLKSEVDRAGYDIVLEANGVIRHVQLKSSFIGSKVRDVSVNTKLLAKPGGCVIWLEFEPDTLTIKNYLWFGGSPGSALPDLGSKVSLHSKANSKGQKLERPMHRVLRKGRFEPLPEINLLVNRMFG
jgi:hypothetical protein